MSVKTPTLAELAAKQAILEVIHRYCRGMDRMDKQLSLSCWHPGGTDDHAPLYSGTAEGFVEWLWPVHAAMWVTRHVVTNTLIELNGDKAGAETYWTVTLRVPYRGVTYDILGGGRYLDRFECIDDVWAIRHRQSVLDWELVQRFDQSMGDFTDPPLILPNNPEVMAPVPARDRTDPSYRFVGAVVPVEKAVGEQLSLHDINDRAAITDVVIKYATALDRRDWALMRSILTDPLAVDYRSFDPALDLEMSVGDWIARIQDLEGFDATQHISANHAITLNGDEATCVSYMQAAHFLGRPDDSYNRFLYGYYTNRLIRTAESWKIRKCTLTITASHGESQIFDWAFSKARLQRTADENP